MILQTLYKDAPVIIQQVYGENFVMPPSMYNYAPLAYVVEIDPTTDKANLIPLPQGDRKKGEQVRADLLPYLGRTSAVAPVLLVDKPAYVFGIEDGKAAASGNNKSRNEDTRQAFCKLVEECYEGVPTVELAAVVRFLKRWNPTSPEFPLPSELRSNDLIGFRIKGHNALISNMPNVQAFWEQYTHDKSSRRMICLVTGTEGDIETKLPIGVKNVPGGKSAGAALSSFNENAFMSYSLREFSAPISREAGEQVGKALNALLQSKRHSTVVGNYDSGIAYAYWSPKEVIELAIFGVPDREVVERLLKSPLRNKPVRLGEDIEEYYSEDGDKLPLFHILGVSSHSGGRVAIRSALTLTLEELDERQRLWFERTRIVNARGEAGMPLSVGMLVEAGFRDRKDVPNYLYAAMVETALANAPPPQTLLPIAVRRCVVGDEISTAGGKTRREHITERRAALLKLLLCYDPNNYRFDEEKVNRMSDFDPEEQNTAYRCGRLLYQLERIQYLAVGSVNATLVDRYYGGASTTPRAVFPHLLRMANQAHLPQIRRERGPGSFIALQNELSEILAPLGQDFPHYFDATNQGRFALGYYFQRAKVSREIAEAKRRKEEAALAGKPVDEETVQLADETELTNTTEENE